MAHGMSKNRLRAMVTYRGADAVREEDERRDATTAVRPPGALRPPTAPARATPERGEMGRR
ncbi:hypothetical protein [Halogeometricum limi]|uniref:hypothetical protein n=1 Tax=Halogeometricum limi TaxID=555875 RepID=UPI0011146001|nr:hypothetical protein [Halogeometricum limi]